MSVIDKEIKNQILTLIQQQEKVKISWVASIVRLTEEEILEIASKLNLKVEGEYLIIAPQNKEVINKKKRLTKEEYDQLNPKPAPTFCEAKKAKN
ncbi:MAG: hypothetical protein EAX90_15085 [Candidatus Heimdallarchaeota archaeon]|nr:hypothetical protein [Candidatus Heimdallarchaeota archaeon]